MVRWAPSVDLAQGCASELLLCNSKDNELKVFYSVHNKKHFLKLM
jgi:hypothetical protein